MGREILSKSSYLLLILVSGILLVGCIDLDDEDDPENLNNTPSSTQNISDIKSVAYTYHSENGNRLVQGQGVLPNLTPLDITLPDTVTWIAAATNDLQSVWAVILESGQVKAYKVTNNSATEVAIMPNQVSTTIPPTLVLENDGNVKLANVFEDGSAYSSPVILDKDTGDRVYIANNGDVVLKSSTMEQRLAVNALSYARLLLDSNKRILVLTDPTSRLDHVAVLGSGFQHASSITIIDTDTFSVSSKITIDAPDAVEGNALIWTDVNNDGTNEIITTLSSDGVGARIVVFNEDGSEYAESSAIGLDNRWRHQIAVAPYKSATETNLVSVYIPHLGPKIEYFRLDDQSMAITNQTASYSSHLWTGVNIDMGISGDFDNDGKLELLLVNHASRGFISPSVIGAFEYDESGINLDWTLDLTGLISSNVAAVTLSNNTIAYGVGQGANLRIWHS